MAIEALTRSDKGDDVVPSTAQDWMDWVSATETRNYILGDPLLDWLNLYGTDRGFRRDDELHRYDRRTDYTEFIFEQGRRFEASVMAHIRTLADVVTIAPDHGNARDLAIAEATFYAMQEGAPVIYQGVLRDAQRRTYGAPDLLIRSDVLLRLFPGAISELEAGAAASHLGTEQRHYRVLDIKFSTLHLAVDGTLANNGSSPAYKVQLFTYNRALGRLQGLEPDASYLLGRGWEQTIQKVAMRGSSCMERLAPVRSTSTLAHKQPITQAADAAYDWVRQLRSDGRTWQLLPDPSRPELYPNLGNPQDGPWHTAKRRIAEDLEDLTLLWQVGVPGRKQAHQAGVYRWRDACCTPAVVGVTGETRPTTLQALMEVNRTAEGPPVRPSRISASEHDWRPEPPLEFYVDFETVNDLADDFARIPERGGQALIFMIGCGHVENDGWTFRCFVADDLTEESEARIIDSWLDHMESVRQSRMPDGDRPMVIHWSPAEVSNFETAYNSARQRHPDKEWSSPRWFDFLNRVIKAEPVVVRGAMAFGLKVVAKAMHEHGLIDTVWADGPADGLGAMVGAWWCEEAAKRTGVSLQGLDLMQEILQYNEVDCRVMMEAVRYLRQHH